MTLQTYENEVAESKQRLAECCTFDCPCWPIELVWTNLCWPYSVAVAVVDTTEQTDPFEWESEWLKALASILGRAYVIEYCEKRLHFAHKNYPNQLEHTKMATGPSVDEDWATNFERVELHLTFDAVE